jgi:starch synthase (maltosyl-transferring)
MQGYFPGDTAVHRHIFIEAVEPAVDAGQYPVKRVVGDTLVVAADIFRDGHELLRAQFCLRDLCRPESEASRTQLLHFDNDRFQGETKLTCNTDMVFVVEAWTDVYGTWLQELSKKVTAGLQVKSELSEGAALLQQALASAQQAPGAADAAALVALLQSLEAAQGDGHRSHALLHRTLPRRDLVRTPPYPLTVDRPQARFSTWYEMFPRSAGSKPGVHATFFEAQARLPHIATMGFDVLYLPPIHPIGITHRKGPNNALVAGPQDPGCPWAIGAAAGGHDAVEPALGTLEDFDAFVAAAARQRLEIALDFAVQCSPDHPWVQSHPQWFYHRPDGSIKYAENPPKKYEDVYPVNFDTEDQEALWAALLNLLLFWVGHGVKIFRVDNPHTKPFAFWQWAMAEVRRKHPEVLFLAEAFTRPKVMKLLGKIGFSQSYTYFTWRNTPAELRAYLEELTQAPMCDFYRPNFFANTPDILPEILQTGGRAAFKMRLLLAATLSPSYGIYSGFELSENAALVGREEYLDSEKYVVRVRDFSAPHNLCGLITRINHIRRENPALQHLQGLQFFDTDNPNLLAFGKRCADNIVLVAINMDPHQVHHGTVQIPADFFGKGAWQRYEVVDLLDGAVYNWGQDNYVRLMPDTQPAHVLRVEKFL